MTKHLTLLLFIGLVWGQESYNYSLPVDFPNFTINTSDTSDSSYVFFTSYVGTSQASDNYLIIISSYGNPIYFKKVKSKLVTDFKVFDDGFLSYIKTNPNNFQKKVIIMNSSYEEIDSITTTNYMMDSHESVYLSNGNWILIGKFNRTLDLTEYGGYPAATVTDNIIQEINSLGDVVFEWNTSEYFSLFDMPHHTINSQFIDYAHINSIHVDSDTTLVISSRHLDEITKINRISGEIIWRFGGLNNQFLFINDTATHGSLLTPFCHQHDARILENGNLTFFDNGNNKNAQYSRMVEYELDETNLIATLVWEYIDNADDFCNWMGNAQRLSNNNTIGTWNYKSDSTSIIEVKEDCTKVFELAFKDSFNIDGNKMGVASYRAFRHNWNGKADRPYLWLDSTNNFLRLNFVQFGDSDTLKYFIYQGTNTNALQKIDSTQNNYYEISNFSSDSTQYFRVGTRVEYDDSQEQEFEEKMSNLVQYQPNYNSSITEPINSDYNIGIINFPNPFNPITTIKYNLPEDALVNIIIYDILGNIVKNLVYAKETTGYKSVQWNATNNQGEPVSAGVYLYKIQAGDFVDTKKMILLK
tara:strand:+ start:32 stop:1786 length:1755 start_codon:yes stop_codon:yes gene_type:complete